MILGRNDRLHFEVNLSSQSKHLGLGSLRVGVGKSQIWGNKVGGGIDWTWIDLLEQLALSWPFLKYEESAPPGTYGATLSLLRTGHPATRDFDFEPATEVPRETYVFLRRHNLATGIEGLYLPSFSLLREGRKIWVASLNVAKLLDFSETLETLSELGNVLSAGIASAASDERARLAVEAWRNREPTAATAIEIKLGAAQLAMVPSNQTVASYFEVTNDGEFESPLLLAARMSAAVPLENRRRILELVRAVPGAGVSNELEELSVEAQSAVPTHVKRAHKQGEVLAQWARKRFNLAHDAKADPEAILKELGVQIQQHHFGVDMIDAVGCWSDKHGPAVLVNVDGIHAHATPGRRATLAHELAHVLVDRHGSLPAAEVLGDDAPLIPEQRASAFAAEFLLPKSVAAEKLVSLLGMEQAINKLRREFEVSRELAAWQIINGPAFHGLSAHDKQLLNRWTAEIPYARLF
jgi:Zn-dependent peptidase ImmA (M78 family)